MMLLKVTVNLVFLTILAPLVGACGRTVRSGACTAAIGTSSGLLKEKSLMSEKYKIPSSSAGGILETKFLTDLETGAVESRFCTALVTFPTGSVGSSVRLWTADHCFWPAFTTSMTLHLSLRDGYVPFEVKSDIQLQGQLAREKAQGMSFSGKNLLFRAVNGKGDRPERLTSIASTKCKKFDAESLAKKNSSATEVCFSLNDLTSFIVQLPSTFNEDQQDALRDSLERDLKFSSGAQKLASTSRATAAQLTDISFAARANTAASDLFAMLGSCPGKQDDLTPQYCAEKEKIVEILVSLPSLSQSVISGASRLEAKSSLSVAEKIVTQNANLQWSQVDKLSELLWSNSSKIAGGATVHLNLFEAGIILRPKSYTWFPLLFGANPQVLKGKGVDEKAIIFNFDPRSGLQLHPGDSGSVVMVGDVPVAVLSTKEGAGTSGGASLINLPTRKKPASDDQKSASNSAPEPLPPKSESTAPSTSRSTNTSASPTGGVLQGRNQTQEQKLDPGPILSSPRDVSTSREPQNAPKSTSGVPQSENEPFAWKPSSSATESQREPSTSPAVASADSPCTLD